MPTAVRERRSGEAELLRAVSVGSREGWYLLLFLRYVDPDERARNFHLGAGRFDSPKGWGRFMKGLSGEPAAAFTLRNFGIPFDNTVFYGSRGWTNCDAFRWIRKKILRRTNPRRFLRDEETRENPFPIGLSDLAGNPGKWVLARTFPRAKGFRGGVSELYAGLKTRHLSRAFFVNKSCDFA